MPTRGGRHRKGRALVVAPSALLLVVVAGACAGDLDGAIQVKAVDYAFQSVPERLGAGRHRFSFENQSDDEQHEMVILRVNDGVGEPLRRVLELPEAEAMKKVTQVGVTEAPPGEKAKADVSGELRKGRYAMVCFIPVRGREGPPHFRRGMIQEFAVD